MVTPPPQPLLMVGLLGSGKRLLVQRLLKDYPSTLSLVPYDTSKGALDSSNPYFNTVEHGDPDISVGAEGEFVHVPE